jgi:hypothetical protein
MNAVITQAITGLARLLTRAVKIVKRKAVTVVKRKAA